MAGTTEWSMSGTLVIAVSAIDSFQPLASKSTLWNFTCKLGPHSVDSHFSLLNMILAHRSFARLRAEARR